MFKPAKARNMTTPVILQTATYINVQGVNKKTYTDAKEPLFVNWSSYGGTETNRDGVIVIEDTAEITTWYNPNITSGSRLKRTADGAIAIYEIIGEPENVEMRNQIMSFKVRRIKGGA